MTGIPATKKKKEDEIDYIVAQIGVGSEGYRMVQVWGDQGGFVTCGKEQEKEGAYSGDKEGT